MARPSLKNERREQILIAFEACVARYGVEGATLEKVAEEAGLARALIRHNVGNREDLLEALVERFWARSSGATKAMIEALPEKRRLHTLIDWFFDPAYADPELMLIAEALIAASAHDPRLTEQMQEWVNDFVSQLEREIRKEYPDTKNKMAAAVAAGVTGIYFNVESMTPLGPMQRLRKSSKEAALLLLECLE